MTTIPNNFRLKYLANRFNDEKNWKNIVFNSGAIYNGRTDLFNPKIVKNIDYDGNKELITAVYGSYFITENVSRFLHTMFKFETKDNIVLKFHDEIIIYKYNNVEYATIINVDTMYASFNQYYKKIKQQKLNHDASIITLFIMISLLSISIIAYSEYTKN